jgi:hypothetical protein
LLRGPFQFQPITAGQEFADANHGQHKIRYLSGTLHRYSGPNLRVVTMVPFISLSFACFMKSLSPSMRTEI